MVADARPAARDLTRSSSSSRRRCLARCWSLSRSWRRSRDRGRGGEFGLDGGRVDSVGVQALPNCPGLVHEGGHVRVRHEDVRRRDRLALVQPPDVQLVHRLDAGDL